VTQVLPVRADNAQAGQPGTNPHPSVPVQPAARHYDDPVEAYSALGARNLELRRRRQAYLDSTEEIIARSLSPGSRSLLDAGAGDGARALRLASRAAIERIVLIEPSASMIGSAGKDVVVWPVRAEELSSESIGERFDVILCLWNVLGHVPTAERRLRALRSMARLLSSQGSFFLDVTHRYNLRSYGLLPTVARLLRDLAAPHETNGDVRATWSFPDETISTYGHVFTHREILGLTAAAGLQVQEQYSVDYQTGQIRRLRSLGNLLYRFRPTSRMDSSSAPATS